MGQIWREKPFYFRSTDIDSIDELRSTVDGSEVDIVQLGRGRLSGHLARGMIGDVAFSRGDFSLPIRSSGVLSGTKVTIGVILESSDTVKGWAGIIAPGDLCITPPGFDHHAVYTGSTSLVTLSAYPDELARLFAGEDIISEPEYWSKRQWCRAADGRTAAGIERQLLLVTSRLAQNQTWPFATTDFWRRSLVEAFVGGVARASSTESSAILPSSTKIVKEVEHYVDERNFRPVHISEICAHLKISRRTLHRCFEDALGIGPGAFLRRKRLCSVHSALRRHDSVDGGVTRIATEFGFIHLGRFSHYYRLLFGEHPIETLRHRWDKASMEERQT